MQCLYRSQCICYHSAEANHNICTVVLLVANDSKKIVSKQKFIFIKNILENEKNENAIKEVKSKKSLSISMHLLSFSRNKSLYIHCGPSRCKLI